MGISPAQPAAGWELMGRMLYGVGKQLVSPLLGGFPVESCVFSWARQKGSEPALPQEKWLIIPHDGSRAAPCLWRQLPEQQGSFSLLSRACDSAGNCWCLLVISQPQAAFFQMTRFMQNCCFLDHRQLS